MYHITLSNPFNTTTTIITTQRTAQQHLGLLDQYLHTLWSLTRNKAILKFFPVIYTYPDGRAPLLHCLSF